MKGRRVDDHSFWAGKSEDGSVLPKNSKVKLMEDGEGAGEVMNYQDSPEAIEDFQDMQRNKVKNHPMKDGYRN